MAKPGEFTPPGLRLVKTFVLTCTSCKRWVWRGPQWCCTGDKGDSCQYCGCTSVYVRDGRPFGPRSKQWAEMVEWFNEQYRWLGNDDMLMETVEVEPCPTCGGTGTATIKGPKNLGYHGPCPACRKEIG